jgi:hypothetical protein
VSDENTLAPELYDGLDPIPEPKSALSEVSGGLRAAVNRFNDVIEAGREPGMPLSILSNITREAPLGSLFIAFLLGVAVARRRTGARHVESPVGPAVPVLP